jgi:hypothetical protein
MDWNAGVREQSEEKVIPSSEEHFHRTTMVPSGATSTQVSSMAPDAEEAAVERRVSTADMVNRFIS